MSRTCLPIALALGLVAGCTSSQGDVFRTRPAAPGAGATSVGGSPAGGAGGSDNASSGEAGEAFMPAGGAGSSDCGQALFCTGFEDAVDRLEAEGTGTAEIVSMPVHAGTGALRVSTAAPNDWGRLEVPLPGLSRVGVRLWAMVDPSTPDFGISEVHVLVALHPAAELGIGGINKVSIDLEAGYQLKLIETISPDKRHSDSPLTPGEWHCLQLEVAGPEGLEQATFGMDEMLRASTNAEPSVVSPGGFQSLLFGIEYSTGATPLVVYYDDVAVAETAPPCDG